MLKFRNIFFYTLGALSLGVSYASGADTFYSGFTGSTAPNWSFGTESGGYMPSLTAAEGIDPEGEGWLRLTTDGTNQSNYGAHQVDLAAVNNRITVTFDYTSWGGSGADGITWFLYDAAVEAENGGSGFSPGGYGGSLGYANYQNGTDGLTGGYLGVGVDEFGNYSNPTEGRNGGPGFLPNEVALRGPGSEDTGYEYISGTGDNGIPSVGESLDFANRPEPGTATEANYFRFKMELDEQNMVNVFMSKDPENGAPFELLFSADMDDFHVDLDGDGQVDGRPDTLRFGFAASTGGQTNYHEVRSLSIYVSDPIPTNAHYWVGKKGNLWGDKQNWKDPDNKQGVPTDYGHLYFEDDAQGNPHNVDLEGMNRFVGSINIDDATSYSLSNGDLTFQDNDASRTTSINVTDYNGISSITHQINANITATEDLRVNNSAISAQLNLNGTVDLDGNNLEVVGQGTTQFTNSVSNVTQLTKKDAGNLIIQDTVDANTTQIQAGTVTLNNTSGEALQTSSIDLQGGTLLLNSSNQISDTANITLSGGSLNLNDNQEILNSLTLSAISELDMGATTGGTLELTEGITYTSGTLIISNWSGNIDGYGDDRFIVSQQPTEETLNNIYWSDQGLQGAQLIDLGNGQWEITPTPEPATIFSGIIMGLVAIGHAWRRRRRAAPPLESNALSLPGCDAISTRAVTPS